MEQIEHTVLTTPDLYNEELDLLLSKVSSQVTYPPKHIFSRPGEPMDHIFYIKKGRTKHYMDNEEGSTKILYTLTPGWFFGETPCFLKCTTGLYSQTETDTVLYCIPSKECRRLLRESELFVDHVIKCFAHKMLIVRYEIANLTFNPCKSRIKRLFCASVDTETITEPGWYNLKIRYTQGEVGEIVGGARVTISRLINDLCSEGFLRLINRRVQVNIAQYKEYMTRHNPE